MQRKDDIQIPARRRAKPFFERSTRRRLADAAGFEIKTAAGRADVNQVTLLKLLMEEVGANARRRIGHGRKRLDPFDADPIMIGAGPVG